MLHLEVITPEKIIYKDDIDEVLVPTSKGQIGILPDHINLLTQVTSGEIHIKKGGKDQFLAVTGGFLEVSQNKITILADYAVRSEDIEVARAQEAKKRAEKLMEEKTSEKDFARIEADLQKSLLELKVAERRKHRANPMNTS